MLLYAAIGFAISLVGFIVIVGFLEARKEWKNLGRDNSESRGQNRGH